MRLRHVVTPIVVEFSSQIRLVLRVFGSPTFGPNACAFSMLVVLHVLTGTRCSLASAHVSPVETTSLGDALTSSRTLLMTRRRHALRQPIGQLIRVLLEAVRIGEVILQVAADVLLRLR